MIPTIVRSLSVFLAQYIEFYTITIILTPKYKTKLLAFWGTLTHFVIYCVTNFSSALEAIVPAPDTRHNIRIFGFLITFFGFIFLLFKDNIKEKLKLGIIMQIAITIFEGLGVSAIVSVLGITLEENAYGDSVKNAVVNTIFTFLAYVCVHIAVRLLYKKIQFNIPASVLINLAIIVTINFVIIIIVYSSNYANQDPFTFAVLLISPVLIVILCFSLFKLIMRISDAEILKEKYQAAETIKALELDYYNNLQEKTEYIRHMRHDFKDVVNSVRLLINENTENSIEKANQLLEELDNEITNTKLPKYSDNIVINTVVGAKAELAEKNNIAFEACIKLPDELPIAAIDLNYIFLNLLNNAIEATKKLPENERKITLKSSVAAGFLVIKTENPFNEIVYDEKGKIKTTKTDTENHGYGLTIINNIAEKHDGSFTTDISDNIFSAVVALRID